MLVVGVGIVAAAVVEFDVRDGHVPRPRRGTDDRTARAVVVIVRAGRVNPAGRGEGETRQRDTLSGKDDGREIRDGDAADGRSVVRVAAINNRRVALGIRIGHRTGHRCDQAVPVPSFKVNPVTRAEG